MKGRRGAARKGLREGMAFEAELADVTASEHARVGGAVGLMACVAGLHANGCMFKREGAALVGVARIAGDFVAHALLDVARGRHAVRIMAIAAMDGALRELVAEGPFKGGADSRMARGAEGIAGPLHIGGVDAVAAGAGDAVAGVGGLKAMGLALIGGVAAEAGAVDGVGLAAGEDFEFGGVECFDVGETGSVTGLAGAALVSFIGKSGGLRRMADNATIGPDKSALCETGQSKERNREDCPFNSHGRLPIPGDTSGSC